MASVGLLLMLMMSTFFLISTLTVSTSADLDQQGEIALDKLKKGKELLKKVLKNSDDIIRIESTALTVIKEIASVLKDTNVLAAGLSVLSVLPVVGSVFSLAMTLVIVIDKHVNDVSLLKDIKEEFDQIDLKLDQYHKEQKWEIWAAGAYHKPELKIEIAWGDYKTLLSSLAGAKDDAERKRHKEHFKTSYLKNEDGPKKLRELLKKRETTFINNLGNALAEHVKCHEKEIIRYTVFILMLIFKGNMMNQYYYKLNNVESKARDDELNNNVYTAMSAMFEIHQHCLNNSMTYVEADVKPLIDRAKERDDLAKEVWSFLSSTYDRYDWMIVAFITKKSSHKIIKTLNKHVLSGFTHVSTERITVALARQVKGTHTKAKEVSEAIKKCVPGTVWCYEVAEKLSKCGEKVGNIPVTQTYTAVHAYTRKAHQSIDAKVANPDPKASPNTDEDDDEVSAAPENSSDQTPYIYTGNCKKFPGVKGGKFVVLIKSDEEMMVKDPCSKLDCGEGETRGNCAKVNDIFLAMCQCKHPYYGLHCENNINSYRTDLEIEALLVVMDSRKRVQH